MTEYVYSTDEHEGHWITGEEVVRCRDCAHIRRFGQPPSQERLCCGLHGDLYATDPDGFCAWGKRQGEPSV